MQGMEWSKKRVGVVDLLCLTTLLLLSVYPVYSMVSNYTSGDQVHYRLLYEQLASVSNVKNVLIAAQAFVSSREIVSPMLLWFGAVLGIDKDVYITALNILLLGVLTFFLRRNYVGWVIILLCLSNFYLIVLFTGAERLKIAYIFILLAGTCSGKARTVMLVLSMLAHFQMILLVAGLAAYFKGRELMEALIGIADNFKVKLTHALGALSGLIVLLSLIVIPGVVEGLMSKADSYMSAGGFNFSGFLQYLVLLLCFLAAREFKVGYGSVFLLILFLVSIGLLGGQRVNMIFFTAVFFVLVVERRLRFNSAYSWPFVLILVYLSFKSISFVENIYLHGDGFLGL